MKWIRSFLIGMLVLLMASGAWAAGTIVVATDTGTATNVREVSYTVTFGADASSPDAVSLDDIVKATTGGTIPTLGGWWLLKVHVYYGATGPTDNSDLYLYRNTGTNKADVLGGKGVNAIDNATNNTFTPYSPDSSEFPQPLYGDEIVSISNNAVNDAVCTIVFELYK